MLWNGDETGGGSSGKCRLAEERAEVEGDSREVEGAIIDGSCYRPTQQMCAYIPSYHSMALREV